MRVAVAASFALVLRSMSARPSGIPAAGAVRRCSSSVGPAVGLGPADPLSIATGGVGFTGTTGLESGAAPAVRSGPVEAPKAPRVRPRGALAVDSRDPLGVEGDWTVDLKSVFSFVVPAVLGRSHLGNESPR